MRSLYGSREIPSKFNRLPEQPQYGSYNQLLYVTTFQDKTIHYNNKPPTAKLNLNFRPTKNCSIPMLNANPVRILDAPKVTSNPLFSPIDWSSQNVIALALSSKLYLRYLDSETTQLIGEIHDQYEYSALRFSEQEILCAATTFGDVQIIDCSEKRVLSQINVGDTVQMADFLRTLLVCASEERGILLIDLRCKNQFKLEIAGLHFQSVRFSNDELYLAGGSIEGEIGVWDVRNMRVRVQTYQEHQGRVTSLDWSENKLGHLIAGGLDGKVINCNCTTGEIANEYQLDSKIYSLKSGLNEIYCGLENGQIRVLSQSSESVTLDKHSDAIIDICKFGTLLF